MNIKEISKDKRIDQFFIDRWQSDFIVSNGERLYGHDLNGFAISDGDEIIALLTYHLKNNNCEIVTLDSVKEKQGNATALIQKMIEKANELKANRLWLMTTNDNLDAIKFYQNRGFIIRTIHSNAIEESRKLGQNIPEIGCYGIPVRDEIELEYQNNDRYERK